MHYLWPLADSEDIAWLRAQVDNRWLRLALLVSVLGPAHRFNASRLARELGLSRGTVTRWLRQLGAS